jgi:phosphate uptake regulator
MVAEGLPAATQALVGGRSDAAPMLGERDRVADALYVEAEELACRQILLQAPVASDLRFLVSVLRIVPELKRSHDLVAEIASRAGHIGSGSLSSGSRELAERVEGPRIRHVAADGGGYSGRRDDGPSDVGTARG